MCPISFLCLSSLYLGSSLVNKSSSFFSTLVECCKQINLLLKFMGRIDDDLFSIFLMLSMIKEAKGPRTLKHGIFKFFKFFDIITATVQMKSKKKICFNQEFL